MKINYIKQKIAIILFLVLAGLTNLQAQQDSIPAIVRDSLHFQADSLKLSNTYNILAPAKAAFYSAVLPGLGQAYNKQYWKIPIVYGAIGAGVAYYMFNDKEYKKFRQAYFDRVNGLEDEFPEYDKDVLIKAQKYYRRQRDTALILIGLAYVLNIIDANVSAHLKQWNVNDNLSFEPVQIPLQSGQAMGLQMNLKF